MLGKLADRWAWRAAKRLEFYDIMAGFVADGKPVFETLQMLQERWQRIKDPRARLAARMLAEMRGKNAQQRALRFAEAVAIVATPVEAMAVEAGESSGDTAAGLRMAASITREQGKIASALKSELAYPAFLFALVLGLLYLLRSAVIPVFDEIMPRHSWPPSARALGWLADNAGFISLSAVGALAGLALVFGLSAGRWTGSLRAVFDRLIPPWSLYRQMAAATQLACFAAFIQAGVPFSQIIDNLMRTASRWQREHLQRMKLKMRRGATDAQALASELFDEATRWEIEVYGGMSGFAQALGSISRRMTERTIALVKSASGLVRTLAMFGVAGMIIWVYGTFFTIVMAARNAAG